jgi:hypothetical protein
MSYATLNTALQAWAKSAPAQCSSGSTLTCGQFRREVLNPMLIASGMLPWNGDQQVRRYIDQKMIKGTQFPYTIERSDGEIFAVQYTARALVDGPSKRRARFAQ